MVGRTLGHYRVLDTLGKGGMGEVYLAEDTTLKRQVALKVLPTDVTSDQERLERFQREAESLAALNHPNIVHVYSVEKDQGTHFLTMELVEGNSLDHIITSRGLPLEKFFDLAIPLADALSDAHEQGIVHRDLKPNNIMVDRKGRPKILDFGLAKLRRPDSSEDMSQLPTEVMTQEGRVLGTYPYMSPEQVEGKTVDHRSDLFSFGTVLYEMATGQRPFHGDSPASLMSSILRDPVPDADLQREDLPHHLTRILGRCLEKDPEDRYQRAKDLRNDLEELRQEVQTGASTLAKPSGSSLAKRSWAGAALGALALLAAGFLLLVAKPWEKASTPTARPLISSLAVLPLENLSGDPDEDYYAAGITDGLIADLGQVSALRVISRQSVMRYRNSDKSLPEIAKELGVEALIEGSVLPAGDRVRVTTQLVQADPEQHLWSDTYERDAQDILELLSEVTRAIVSEVEVAVSPKEQALLASARTVDPEAYRAYLLGMYHLDRQIPTEIMMAAEYFHQAIELDSTYAPAWAGLAAYHLGLELWALPPGAEDLRREASIQADAALKEALDLDDSLSMAHMLMAQKYAGRDWDWQRAEAEFERAIRLSPNDSTPLTWFAWFLTAMGRHEEAGTAAELAEELDPLSYFVRRVRADMYYYTGDFKAAVHTYEKCLELAPANSYAYGQMGSALAAMGRFSEAIEAWQTSARLAGNEALADQYEGKTFEEVSHLWIKAATSASGPAVFALVHARIGEYEEALEWLEKGYATKGDPGKTAGWMFPFLSVEPKFEPMHSDPRFQDLLRRMNLAS